MIVHIGHNCGDGRRGGDGRWGGRVGEYRCGGDREARPLLALDRFAHHVEAAADADDSHATRMQLRGHSRWGALARAGGEAEECGGEVAACMQADKEEALVQALTPRVGATTLVLATVVATVVATARLPLRPTQRGVNLCDSWRKGRLKPLERARRMQLDRHIAEAAAIVLHQRRRQAICRRLLARRYRCGRGLRRGDRSPRSSGRSLTSARSRMRQVRECRILFVLGDAEARIVKLLSYKPGADVGSGNVAW